MILPILKVTKNEISKARSRFIVKVWVSWIIAVVLFIGFDLWLAPLFQLFYLILAFFAFRYEVKEETGASCERCAFRNECQDNLQCGSNERKDGKDVYFKKVENMELGEEQIPDGVIGIEDAKINVDAIKPPTAKKIY